MMTDTDDDRHMLGAIHGLLRAGVLVEVRIYVCVYIYTHTCIHVHIHIRVYMRIYMYIYNVNAFTGRSC